MDRIAAGAPSTVIIADNVFFVRENLRTILEMSGCLVVAEVEDGVDAVVTFKEFRPDVIFLDVNLPFKNGFEVMKEIVTHNRHAKVVMCCTAAHMDLAHEAMAAGASDVLLKPYQPKQVRQVLLNITGGGGVLTPRSFDGRTAQSSHEKL